MTKAIVTPSKGWEITSLPLQLSTTTSVSTAEPTESRTRGFSSSSPLVLICVSLRVSFLSSLKFSIFPANQTNFLSSAHLVWLVSRFSLSLPLFSFRGALNRTENEVSQFLLCAHVTIIERRLGGTIVTRRLDFFKLKCADPPSLSSSTKKKAKKKKKQLIGTVSDEILEWVRRV